MCLMSLSLSERLMRENGKEEDPGERDVIKLEARRSV